MEKNELAVIEKQIRKLLQMPLLADCHAAKMTLREAKNVSPELRTKIAKMHKMCDGLEALYSLLSENERQVIQRHVVDGLDWSCLGAEFGEKWGMENQKSKRSLMNYANSAFKKMTSYVHANQTVFDFSWLFEL